jgi:hypothetical protein
MGAEWSTQPYLSTTCPGTTPVIGGAVDDSYDSKKMLVFDGADIATQNVCVHVKIDKVALSSAGETTVHTMCYYASEVDDEPN